MSAGDRANAIVLGLESELAESGEFNVRVETLKSYQALKLLDDAARLEVAIAAVLREFALGSLSRTEQTALHPNGSYPLIWLAKSLISSIFRRSLSVDSDSIESTCAFCLAVRGRSVITCPSFEAGFWRTVVDAPGELSDISRRWLVTIIREWPRIAKPNPMALARIRERLGEESRPPIEPGEAWSDSLLADLKQLPTSKRELWMQLLEECATSAGGSPSLKWLKAAKARVQSIGESDFVQVLSKTLPLVDMPRTVLARESYREFPVGGLSLVDSSMQTLKGLCWVSSQLNNPEIPRLLGHLAISCLKKLPGIGPRATKVSNAAIWALGQIPGPDAIGQLATLRVKVKFIPSQKAIEKALTAAAERAGLPRAEIEELGVPAYGMTDVGMRREELGDTIVELDARDAKPLLRFFKKLPTGQHKEIKAPPAQLKQQFAADLNELKASLKDLVSMLSAQRDRLDSMFLEDRLWSYKSWHERYLDHPVVGVLARRIIWNIIERDGDAKSATAVLFFDGQLRNISGNPRSFADDASVTLWHPVNATQEETLAWRQFIEEKQVRQPFKQAHREVYLLTDAERRTETYSNRFAAHIVRQHQFKALAETRNWRHKLRLMVDAEYPPPFREIHAHGLRAEFWVEPVGDTFGTDTNEAGAYLHLATDQVRFYRREAAPNSIHADGGAHAMNAEAGNPTNNALAIDQIPPLVLSEILRDCDLFVGVASVGNNPQWNDGGPNQQFREYWQHYSFGELTATAETRRDLLSRLIPRLKIADRCALADRFLTVQGSLRTYKIHLGSGNILMEPNDQYLCIVPSSARADSSPMGVFLPFEGDRTLSIILSKAFMLANDDKINDPSITRQIKQS